MSRVLLFIKQCGRWVGLSSSFLTVLIGGIHIFNSGAKLDWPDYDSSFLDDTGKPRWRDKLFSLRPEVFVECWTPLITGICGLLCHVVQFPRLRSLTTSFFNYFWFLMFQTLFATLGYCGGLGILFGMPGLIAAGCAFIALLLDEDDACLNLNWKFGKLKATRDDIYLATRGA